jgi:acetyl-CoA synthetase
MPADSTMLERELDMLMAVERFAPPAEFAERAVVTDPAIYDDAARDHEGFWAKQAEDLHWDRRWTTVLDESDPPFYRWFSGGRLNASYNCVDRHVLAGHGERVAFHWHGEEGEQRTITYADLHRDVQRLANALKDRGVGAGDVVGIHLPMIMRRLLRDVAEGRELGDVSTLGDPGALAALVEHSRN